MSTETKPLPTPRLLALGDTAWTVEFGSSIAPDTHARVMGLAHRLEQARHSQPLLACVTDVVPTFRSLTVYYDPLLANAEALGEQLITLAQQGQVHTQPGRRWRFPVCMDGDFAPDLRRLAAAKGISPAEVTTRLLTATFQVYMLGFQPGFPYMGGVPAELHMPRLASPRQKVPAQSLAVAGEMCSVYPWESPGGWNLLGRTPVVLFDLRHAQQPALLSAGDEVRWYAVDRQTHDAIAAEIAHGRARETFLEAATS
jgi:KipI family sensor histidine kinase inhibitor